MHQWQAFKKLIWKAGKRQKEIAVELGYSEHSISRLIKQEELPVTALHKIIKYFNVDESYFTEGGEKKEDNTDLKSELKKIVSMLEKEIEELKAEKIELKEEKREKQDTINKLLEQMDRLTKRNEEFRKAIGK